MNIYSLSVEFQQKKNNQEYRAETAIKKWETPELIILVRSKPENAVLAGRKTGSQAPSRYTKSGCSYVYDCWVCSIYVSS